MKISCIVPFIINIYTVINVKRGVLCCISMLIFSISLNANKSIIAKAGDDQQYYQLHSIENVPKKSNGKKVLNKHIYNIDSSLIKLEFTIPRDGKITLPEGTTIDDVLISGDDLMILDHDKRYIIIKNGALNMPSFVIGESEITSQQLEIIIEGTDIRAAAGTSSENSFVFVNIYYATDRARTGSERVDKYYGGDRGVMEYGTAEVSIPSDHRMGELETPFAFRAFLENPEHHIVLQSINSGDKSEFFKSLANYAEETGNSHAFVFIHGYNVTFQDAARRTAQMAYDLGFDGAPILYSWPSKGSKFSYSVDEANSAWSASNITDFLFDLASKELWDDIYIIAHSMGNRPVTQALTEIGQNEPNLRQKFKEIILAAPDIDADVFVRDIAPNMTAKGAGVTLYLSNSDKALLASKAFHGYPRIGNSSDGIRYMPGIDIVDASDLESDFLGHSYYGDHNSILSDMFYLIRERKRPSQRFGLKKITLESGWYWRMKSQ